MGRERLLPLQLNAMETWTHWHQQDQTFGTEQESDRLA